MNYGMYLSAAGVQTSLHKQDVYANNLANANTVGFKPDTVVTRERLIERLEDPHLMVSPHWLLEQLGGGQLVEPTRVMLRQGSLVRTGNDLDIALEGNGFLTVRDRQGETALTRDGRLTVDDSGLLVMTTTGLPVLNDAGEPITITPDVPLTIDSDGAIRQEDVLVDQLALVQPDDPTALRKQGENLFRLDGNTTTLPSDVAVRQGFVESSAVDPVKAMMAMTGAAKAVQSNARMMQYHDQTLNNLFSRVGRVN